MKYTLIITNGLDDSINTETIEAESETQAYEIFEESSHNYDHALILTEEQAEQLKGLL